MIIYIYLYIRYAPTITSLHTYIRPMSPTVDSVGGRGARSSVSPEWIVAGNHSFSTPVSPQNLQVLWKKK